MARPSLLVCLSLLSAFVCVAIAGMASPARAQDDDPFTVQVDHAEIVEIDGSAGTVIVGNPAIVDVQVLSARRLVLTGKGYGVTNLVVLDPQGETIVDERVAVQTAEANTVRVYRRASRTTLACAPRCEPTATIGDDPEAFNLAAGQYQQRQAIAQSAASGG